MSRPSSPWSRFRPWRVRNSVRLMILAVLAPSFLLVVVGVGFALYQLHSVSRDFQTFVATDLGRFQDYAEMRASGLESGQAVRSLMLSPQDAASGETLGMADKRFRAALERVKANAAADAQRREALVRMEAQWDALSQLREMYASTNGVLAGTVERFQVEETPLWREVSAQLLAMHEGESKRAQAMSDEMSSRADEALRTTLLLVGLSLLVSAALTWLILARVRVALIHLHDSMHTIAQGGGNLRENLPVLGECEIGRTSHAFNTFLGGLRGLVSQA